MATDGVLEPAETIISSISRHMNCLTDENRNTRKRALEALTKELIKKDPKPVGDVLQRVLNTIIKPILKTLSDPVEKCREHSVTLLTECIPNSADPAEFVSYIIPAFVQRIGQPEIIETSEEIRLMMVQFLIVLVELSEKQIHLYLDDMVRILQRTIVDPYPEVKKASCRCASKLSKASAPHFHMQSESLIQPLAQTISHQHSRVRVEAINAIGDVIQHGNGKSVDDVVSHLAQRLFDQAPTVRSAVIGVVGAWLLDLLDRYSFFHKLIPLLLTGCQDEMPDIRDKAEGYWHDAGMKFAQENEDDLKDKTDFVKPDPSHYPSGVERPNLGCRELMYRNFSRILNGLIGDLGDWVANTRIKSAGLLYQLLLNEEDNVTQHLQKALNGMYKACHDDEEKVVTYIVKSAELIGYFVPPDIWCKMVLQAVKTTQSMGSLMVLAAILRGTERAQLKLHLVDVTSVLADRSVCLLAEASIQREVLSCVSALIHVAQEDTQLIGQELFNVIVSVIALHRNEPLREQCYDLLDALARAQDLNDRQSLYDQYTLPLVKQLRPDSTLWTQHSTERLLFDVLLLESGRVIGEILDEVMPMLVSNLDPSKDPEVRLKFFTLLSRLLMNAPNTLDSQQRFGDYVVTVVRDMVVPNLVWRAGRTAGAIRTTAVSCLWALLQSGVLTRERLLPVMEELLTQLRSLLEDDNKQTRLIACRTMMHVFHRVGTALDQDRLHNMYPDLLKRLDDSSDDIRVAITKTFLAYFDCFTENYEGGLYRAHLEAIYKGLLVHLDDPEPRIQEAVLEVLLKCSALMPALLNSEVETVRLKHRSTKYLDRLVEHMKSLPIKD